MDAPIVSVNEVCYMLDAFMIAESIPREDIVLGGGAALMLRGLRDTTKDINIWVSEKHFTRLAADNKVICHPMTDTVINPADHPYFWIRKYNPYFGTEEHEDFRCFDLLTMIINKSGGLGRVERPKDKREQDRKDLVILNGLLAEKNRVKQPSLWELRRDTVQQAASEAPFKTVVIS